MRGEDPCRISIIDITNIDAYDDLMRTTLTIDDDLMAQIEDLRRREGISFKGAVNRLLRAGTQCLVQPPKAKQYRTKPRKLGLRSGFDPIRLNQLADEIDAEQFTAADEP